MECVILRGSLDAEVLARVLCSRDAQVRTSFAHLDNLEFVGTSARAVACAFAFEPQPLLPIQKCVLENKLKTKHHSRAVACTCKSFWSTRAVAQAKKKTTFAPSAVSLSHRSWRWPQTTNNQLLDLRHCKKQVHQVNLSKQRYTNAVTPTLRRANSE